MISGYIPSIGERDPDKIVRSIRNLYEFGFDPTTASRAFNVLTPHEGLIVKYVSATTVDIDADAVQLFNSDGRPKRFASLNETLAITTAGANGLDTGSEGSSRWYHIWGIGKDNDTLDGLLSESSTAPTLPSGYTYKGYLGAVYNDSSSDFQKFSQRGIFARTVRGISNNQVLLSGSSTSYAAVSLAAAIPPTATAVLIEGGVFTSSGTATVFFALSSDGATTTATYDEQVMQIPGVSTSAFSVPGCWVNIITAQQIEYYVGGTNGRTNLIVVGWVY